MSKKSAERFFPVEYLNSSLFTAPAKRTISRSCPESPELLVILAGRYQVTPPPGKGDWMIQAGPGDVVYWPAGEERIEQNSTDERVRDMGFYFRWTAPPPALPRMVHDNHGVIRTVGSALLAVKTSPLPQREVMRNSYLTAILAEYIRLAAMLGEGLEAKVALYVQEHMRKAISRDDLAAYVGLHPCHLSRKYKTLTGRSLLEDVRRAKAEHAAATLRNNRSFGLKSVAVMVGVNDPIMLSKWLHKYVGIPVRDLRK